jgi:hypothetical protein
MQSFPTIDLFGAAFFAIPGIGPVLVAGPLVAWIVGALEGAVVVGGLSALGAGLYSIAFYWPTARRLKWPRRGISYRRHTPRSLHCTGPNAKNAGSGFAGR